MEAMEIDEPEHQDGASQHDGSTEYSDTHYSEETSYSEDNDSWSDSSGDEGPQTSVMVGRIITAVFNDNSLIPDTDEDEEDGGDGDNDGSASEMSSTYEELDFPRDDSQIYIAYPVVNTDMEDEDDDSSDATTYYVPTHSGDEEIREDHAEGDDGEGDDEADGHEAGNIKEEGTANDKSPEVAIIGSRPVAVDVSQTASGSPSNQNGYGDSGTWALFANLQENPFPARSFKLNQSYEKARWRILELEEIKRAVEREMAEAEDARDSISKELDADRAEFAKKREELGISMELWDEYMAFCESLEPEPGTVTGWSITCDENHKNSYVGYDPDFALFREHSETAYKQQNFRCEARAIQVWRGVEYVVEFWPVPYPSIDIEDASTWGELYPKLYDLAAAAVQAGSKAAMELLISIPDQHASFKGGWLFEYCTANPSASKYEACCETDEGIIWTQNAVESRRWHFRSAHKVEIPVDDGTKRARLEFALQPESVTRTGVTVRTAGRSV